jgi:hypothetical protein
MDPSSFWQAIPNESIKRKHPIAHSSGPWAGFAYPAGNGQLELMELTIGRISRLHSNMRPIDSSGMVYRFETLANGALEDERADAD